jgi:UvrD-like helicase C-terminal domain
VEYEFSELDEVSLAYAVTIHKAQGSEFLVVITVAMQHAAPTQPHLHRDHSRKALARRDRADKSSRHRSKE